MSGQTMTRVSGPTRGSEVTTLPEDWPASFPLNDRSRYLVYRAGGARQIGVVVYRFTDSEARFVLRGDLASGDELTACLEASEELAGQLACRALVTQEKIRPDWLEAAHIFARRGFAPLDESWIFACPFESFAKRSHRLMQILVRHGAIPDKARVTNLDQGRSLARGILEDALLMDGFDFEHRLEAGASRLISAEHSQLVWVGEQLAGIILVAPTADDGTYEIPVRYVAANYRQTWVNAVLVHSCVQRGEMMGATTIRFSANAQTHHETMRLAEQAGCVRVATSHRYGKELS